MRYTFLLLTLVAFGAAIPPQQKQRAVNQELLQKQQDCIYLLQQINQDIPNTEFYQLGQNYDIIANAHQYQNPIVVQYYAKAVQAGLVQPKGTVFTNSVGQLRKEVSLLQNILLGANNYQTFLNTAAWARVHVNEGQFLQAFTAAILQRKDTQGVILPPPYEILPQYYFDARIIQEAQQIAAQGGQSGRQTYVIPVNYTANLPHGEHQLSYFTQDVGLAAYYGYIHLASNILEQQQQQQQGGVHQTSGSETPIGPGSQYYYLHQQLLAHYHLNRLANGLGPIPEVDYVNVQAPFQPYLQHPNGLPFPGRSEILNLEQQGEQQRELIHYVKTLEQRLIQAIDSGYVQTPQGVLLSLYQPQGLNILGQLIQGTGKSVNPRYYGRLEGAFRQLLGGAPQFGSIYDYTGSVLELGQTCVRDPAFYQLFQKVIGLFHHYQQSLPAYQYNDLVLPGVTIQDVSVSDFTTFFDDFYVNLNEATVQGGQEAQEHGVKGGHGVQGVQGQQQGQIQAQLKRLDHAPYTVKINVQSETAIPGAVVRVYLGPKYDYEGKQISISEHRNLFVELDQFYHDLQQGQNVIVRSSQQAPGQSHDYPSMQYIQQGVYSAINSQQPLYISEPQHIFGFPARLALPKGTPNGLPLQLFVAITSPGQQTQNYGPVIPEQFQTYQQQHYQIVESSEFQQGGQLSQSQIGGVKQAVEVLPETHDVEQQQQWIEAVSTQHGRLYSKQQGQYPYTHVQSGVQGQYGQVQQQPQLHHGQQQQYQHGQQYHGQQQGQQYQHEQQQQYHGQQQYQHGQQYHGQQQGGVGVQGGIQGGVQGTQGGIQGGIQGVVGGVPSVPIGVHGVQGGLQGGVQGIQGGVQGIQGGVQGIQGGVQGGVPVGVQGGVPVGVQGGVQGGAQYGFGGYFGGWQGQGQGQVYYGSGQTHAGGYQGIYQGHVQGQQVGDYFQDKEIPQIIGGAISLDGKPFGYPLDRPLTPGALAVPNVYVRDVQVYHQGQPTNEINQ